MSKIIVSPIPGIYLIKNMKNGNFYLGQSQNLRVRQSQHFSKLRLNKHGNPHLQAAWNKYGEKAFVFVVLEYCPIDQLTEREQHYLDIYANKNNCYNIATDAQKPGRGLICSEETRRKLSEAKRGKSPPNKGKPMSDTQKEKLRGKNNPRFGKPGTFAGRHHSEDARRKQSIAHIGKPSHRKGIPLTEPQKQKLNEVRPKNITGAGNPFFGKFHTEETRHKMREVKQKLTPEQVAFVWLLLNERVLQDDIANIMSVSRSTISNIKRGRCYF